jgi:hypothetical protein
MLTKSNVRCWHTSLTQSGQMGNDLQLLQRNSVNRARESGDVWFSCVMLIDDRRFTKTPMPRLAAYGFGVYQCYS